MRHSTLCGLVPALVAGYLLTGCAGTGNAPRVVEGPPGPLAIRTVVEPPGGGTMHYAEQVTISLPGHKSLVLKTDVGGDVLAPYIRRQYKLPGQRYLLLGHSSWGAGTETVQAILLGARGGRLERLDQLDVTTPRGISAVLLRHSDSQTQIGVFEPTEHELRAGFWWMSHVKHQGKGEAALPVFGPPPGNIRADLAFMSSLVLGSCRESELAGRRVAWFTIRGDRFQDRTDYPDTNYAEEINKRFGDGVTAENNAAAAIARVIGPELFPEEIRRRSAARLGIKWQAGASYLDLTPDLLDSFGQTSGEPWKVRDHPELAKWLTDNAAHLDAFAKASLRPRFYIPAVFPKKGPLTIATMYRTEKLRTAALALVVRAHLAVGENRGIERAWADLLAVHRIGRLMLQDGNGVGFVTGLFLTGLADDETQQMVMALKIDTPLLKKMLADVLNLKGSCDAVAKIGVSDRFLMLDIVQKAARADRKRAVKILRPALAAFFADRREALNRAARDTAEGIAADPQHVERAINGFYDYATDAPMERVLEYVVEPHRQTARRAPKAGEDKVNWAACALIAAGAYGLEEVPVMQKHFETKHRLSVLALALAIHKARNGSYPKSLQPLTAGVITHDPFGRASFRYRLDEDGDFDLYSVGPDGKDNEGADDDLNCGNPLVIVIPKRPMPKIKIPVPYLSERFGMLGSRGTVTKFFGPIFAVHRVAFVIDHGKADEKMLNRLKGEIEKSLSRLHRSQRFVLIVAGKDKPKIAPKEAFVPADTEAKNKASRLAKSLRSGRKDDLLAAVKQAYKLHETDKKRSNTKPGRLIYILCSADPSDKVVEFIKTKQKDAPVKIRVQVYLFGEKGMTSSNAERIVKAANGVFRLVGADATSRPASQPSD